MSNHELIDKLTKIKEKEENKFFIYNENEDFSRGFASAIKKVIEIIKKGDYNS